MLSFSRAERNDEHGCTLKRNETDWLEILKRGLNQSETFLCYFNQVLPCIADSRQRCQFQVCQANPSM